MSLVDTLLARRSVMFTSPLSMAECRDRIGPSSTPSVFGSGANGTSPFIVNFNAATAKSSLTKPWSKWETRRGRCSLWVRFETQADGTFVEVTAGLSPALVVNYALLWLSCQLAMPGTHSRTGPRCCTRPAAATPRSAAWDSVDSSDRACCSWLVSRLVAKRRTSFRHSRVFSGPSPHLRSEPYLQREHAHSRSYAEIGS